MRNKKNRFELLGFVWEQVGYVEHMSFFGYELWFRCGSVRRLFGIEWIQNDR